MRSRDTFEITELLWINFVLNVLKNPVGYKALPYLYLAKQSVRETGLSLSTLGGFVLGMGTTMACFHCLGTTPSLYEQFKISVAGELNS